MLSSAGFYKVGVTGRHPRDRIKDLQTGNPFAIELVGMFPGDARTEEHLHAKFRHRHVRGEWYDLNPDLQRAGDSWEALLGLEAINEPRRLSLFDTDD